MTANPFARDSAAKEAVEDAATSLGLVGYKGPGCDYPRKYIRGDLQDAWKRKANRNPVQEYVSTCRNLGAHPNSVVKELLTSKIKGSTIMDKEIMGGDVISLRQTIVGERGFLAILPMLDRNTRWRFLDASNNGLRNEAVLHFVDMLLRPKHTGRRLYIDLSRNPISEGAGKALLQLVKVHPGIESLNLSMTKIPRRLLEQIRRQLEHERRMRDPDPDAARGSLTGADTTMAAAMSEKLVDPQLSVSDPALGAAQPS